MDEDKVAKWRSLTSSVIDDGRRDESERIGLRLDRVQAVKELASLLEGHARCPIVVGGRS